jgi:hypothetical protein
MTDDKQGIAHLDGESSIAFNPFRCKCGCESTGGGIHCNYIRCPKCRRIYEFPFVAGIVLKEVAKAEFGIEPVELEEW